MLGSPKFVHWEVWAEDEPDCGDWVEAINVSAAAERFASGLGLGDGEQVTVRVSNGKREWRLLVTCTEITEYDYRSALIEVTGDE